MILVELLFFSKKPTLVIQRRILTHQNFFLINFPLIAVRENKKFKINSLIHPVENRKTFPAPFLRICTYTYKL